MMRPSLSARIRLARRLTVSRIRRRVLRSPNSSAAETVNVTTRSSGVCSSDWMMPLPKYLRSSMQNIGG